MRAPVTRLILLILLLAACGNSEPPRQFREAFDVLDKTLSKERLERSSFAPRYPDPTAKQIVSYLFSQAGAEVLQISKTPLSEDVDLMSGTPVWPRSVGLWHSRLLPNEKYQVILKWNDSAKVVIGEAYEQGVTEPVYLRQWEVTPLAAKKPIDPSDTREFQAF